MSFNEMSAQQQAQAAAALLRSSGAPATAENLNRAMMALMQGTSMTGDNSPVMERAMQRSMAPRRATTTPAPVPAARGAAGVEQPVGGDPDRDPGAEAAAGAVDYAAQDAAASRMLMEGNGRAVSNGDDMISLAMLMGGAPALLARGQPMLTMNRPNFVMRGPGSMGAANPASTGGVVSAIADDAAQYAGRVQMPTRGRMLDVPSTATSGPAQQAMLTGPSASQAAIAGGGNAPMISGSAARALPAPAGVSPTAAREQAMAMSRGPAKPQAPNRNAQGPQRGQQGEAPASNATRNPSPRAGEARPRNDGLRQRLMARRAQEDAKRASRTGRD